MAFIPPVAADLVARFPGFAAVPAPALAAVLAEAQARVDATWTAPDAWLGTLLYAAHVLTLDGQGSSAEAALGAAGALGFTQMRAGDLTLQRPADGSAGILSATTYGRRFLALLRANQPAVLVP